MAEISGFGFGEMVEPTPFGSRLTTRQGLLQARLIEGPDFDELVDTTLLGKRLSTGQQLCRERI